MLSSLLALTSASLLVKEVSAAKLAQSFIPVADSPTSTSANYIGASNGSLPISPVVPGLGFDRFIQIWLENTNFDVANTNAKFQKIAKQGLTLTSYNAVTHPSEPNYLAAVGGDFFGLADDDFYYIPSNASTIVDLLEAKNVSWSTYQENMPSDSFQGDFAQTNYLNASAGAYTYYKRKHNPLQIFNSVANVTERAARIRNFNDFAVDVNASALPQWVFITPNMVNDGHDTTIDFLGDWVDWFLTPLLSNKNFNDDRTLILLTFDENEDYGSQNTVMSILLGGAVANSSVGQTDDSYYSHYSTLSTVEHNWQLGNLGRGDVNKTMNNVFSIFADTFNVTNNNLTLANNAGIPLTNLTGIYSGALNSESWQPIPAPIDTPGAGGGATFFAPGVNKNMTQFNLPAAINVTGFNPVMVNPGIPEFVASGNNSSSSSSSSGNSTTSSTTNKTSGAYEARTISLAAFGISALGAAAFVL